MDSAVVVLFETGIMRLIGKLEKEEDGSCRNHRKCGLHSHGAMYEKTICCRQFVHKHLPPVFIYYLSLAIESEWPFFAGLMCMEREGRRFKKHLLRTYCREQKIDCSMLTN